MTARIHYLAIMDHGAAYPSEEAAHYCYGGSLCVLGDLVGTYELEYLIGEEVGLAELVSLDETTYACSVDNIGDFYFEAVPIKGICAYIGDHPGTQGLVTHVMRPTDHKLLDKVCREDDLTFIGYSPFLTVD